MVELEDVHAKVETVYKSTIIVSAQASLYNRNSSTLSLNRDVVIKSSAGFEMHLDEAVVDTGSGEVVSNKPVSVFTQDATLNAERLEVEKSGDVVRFIGNVVMNLNPPDKLKQPATNR